MSFRLSWNSFWLTELWAEPHLEVVMTFPATSCDKVRLLSETEFSIYVNGHRTLDCMVLYDARPDTQSLY